VCGIFATTRPDLWDDRVPEILSLLRHRGPDGEDIWRSGDGPFLGHTRLAIIGLTPEADQPLTSADGSLTITFNGEIYNYVEIAADLGIPDAGSDTRVLVETLRRWGVEGLQRLRGMYAFLAWDQRLGRLIAGRDPWGIKPLYVLHHAGGGVTLASEIPPLLLLPEARTIDPAGLGTYLSFGHTGQTVTMFQRIRKVAPGSAWEWRRQNDGRWEARAFRIGEHTVDPSLERALADAVDDSVAAHLVADVEVGVFLSGGTDSTLIADAAARLVPDLRTFTLSFPGFPAIDESERAAANARLLGSRHRTIPVDADVMRDAARTVLGVHGEPFGDAAALPLTILARAAREDVKVALTGEGADELFGGYRRYRVSRMLELPALPAVRWATRPLARAWSKRRDDGPNARAIEAMLWGGGVQSHAALLLGDLNALSEAASTLGRQAELLARSDWEAVANGEGERGTARSFDLRRWLPNMYLEKADRATMAHGLEARVPYLDPVVASVAESSVRQRFGKEILQRELRRRLPEVRLPDEKKGLSVDLRSLLEGDFRSLLRFELGARDSLLRRLLGPSEIHTIRQRCARSGTSRYRVAMLGLWEEMFDGSTFS
jgi:asparagine synthase (glutamine-hydrolysing)